MADEELEPQKADASASAQGESEASGDGSRQPEGQDWSKVNLDEIPQFRDWKSKMDQREAERQNQLKQEAQARQQLQQQLDELRMSQMTDQQRYEYEQQKQQEILQEQYRQMQAREAYAGFVLDLTEISKDTGVPFDEIADSQDLKSAYRTAMSWVQENPRRAKRNQAQPEGEHTRSSAGDSDDTGDTDEGQQAASAPGNRVDTGSGRPPSANQELRKRYEEAQRTNDVDTIMDLHQEAAERGVEL